jgi:crotonobetainyl-CoA:carnitine CoA-transferase CaiB-like acyl-CoA transferase
MLEVLAQREMFVGVTQPDGAEIKVTGRPIKFPDRNLPSAGAAPGLGEHTDEVLNEILGMSDAEILEMERSGAVARWNKPTS